MRNELIVAGIAWAIIIGVFLLIYIFGFIPGSCLGMVEFSGTFNNQWIQNDMLYINYTVDDCNPILYCEDKYCEIQNLDVGCQRNDFDLIYFQKEDNRLMFLDKGDYISIRWCEIPGIGYRIRDVSER